MLNAFREFSAIITDTRCFILLEKIEALPILNQLFHHVVTTPEIANEFGRPLPEWVKIYTVKDSLLQNQFLENVDLGEASALALAFETPSSLVIIDDLKGRKLAQDLNLTFTGTLGILILAKNAGIIPKLRPLFEKLKSTDFRVSDMLLTKILDQVGE